MAAQLLAPLLVVAAGAILLGAGIWSSIRYDRRAQSRRAAEEVERAAAEKGMIDPLVYGLARSPWPRAPEAGLTEVRQALAEADRLRVDPTLGRYILARQRARETGRR